MSDISKNIKANTTKDVDIKAWLSFTRKKLSPFELRALRLLKQTREEDYKFISELLNVHVLSSNKSYLKKNLRSYVLSTLLKTKPFSSFDILQMYLVSLRLLPLGLLKHTMKSKAKSLLLKNLKVLKLKGYEKSFPLAIEVLSNLPFSKERLSSDLEYYKEILNDARVSFILLDIFHLVSRSRFIKDELFVKELACSLKNIESTPEKNADSKGVLLNIEEGYFELVLSALKLVEAKNLELILSIDISLISLSELVASFIEVYKASKIKLALRLVCYENKEDTGPLYFKAGINKYASLFATLRELASKGIKTHIVTNDLSIMYLSHTISKDFIYEIDSMLNPALLKLALRYNLKVLSLKTLSPSVTTFFHKRLKTAMLNLKNYTIKRSSEVLKSDVYKGFNTPPKTFLAPKRSLLKHDFENFKVALRHRLKPSSLLSECEISRDLKSDIAFLASVENRILLVKKCIDCLDKNLESFFTSLYELYDTSSFIVSELVYNVVDILNFYAYRYKRMREVSSNIAFNPYKLVSLQSNLNLEELVSLVIVNLLNGNILVLKDSKLTRVLSSVFSEALELCAFMVFESKLKENKPNLYIKKAPIKLDATTLAFRSKEEYLSLCEEGSFTNLVSDIKAFSLVPNVIYVSDTSDINLALMCINYALITNKNIKAIYANSYFSILQEAFKIEVFRASLEEFIQKEKDLELGSISLFSYSKREQDLVIKGFKTNVNINVRLEYKLESFSYQDHKPGLLSPFGSSYLLEDFSLPKTLNFKSQKSGYCDVIGALSRILNEYELEFLRSLSCEFFEYASRFMQDLEILDSKSKEAMCKRPLPIMLFVSKEDDLLQAGIILIIANILNTKCTLYIEDELRFKALARELSSLSVAIKCLHSDKSAFLKALDSNLETLGRDFLVRILLSQDGLFNSDENFYINLMNKNALVVYNLPLIDARVELPKYVHTTSLNIGGT
ncbi:hypothetical protein BKH43_06660 [Helicobacter sp. 13S00401-1]|uniref:hypothetical protein n=1 Tax=Helicobacter sp. 13S00401-1 TaxID=1905758 RepID=UPI000BA4E66F|nr:hypothetical protein [Helicobacter sp. 13S00401-1]PAF49681.1 hypothetical protein BKH43_06660 [Helicobacter sp. 13S00401-1]